MGEWKDIVLDNITTRIGDGLHGTPNYDDNGEYYFINGNNLSQGKIVIKGDTKKISKQEFHKHAKPLNERTILLGINGTIGNLAYYKNEKCMLGKSACYINLNDEVDTNFMFYIFSGRNFQNYIEGIATGTTIPNVPLKGLREYAFNLPPLSEQIQIASILSSLDDKIDLVQRQNKTLEQLAESLFRQWFVEEAEEEATPLENWIFFDPREKMDKDKSYQVFDMKCLSNSDMSIGEGIVREVTSATIFRNGDTLLAKITPCLENGKTGFVMDLELNEIAKGSTEFIVMRTKGVVSQYWIYCLARSKDFRDAAIQSMTGTSGRQRVQIDRLKSYEVNINLKKMREFNMTVDPFFKKIKSNTKQI